MDGIDLICGPGCGKERLEQILRAGWADPVHPNQHSYSKMALNLVEKIAAANSPPADRSGREVILPTGLHSPGAPALSPEEVRVQAASLSLAGLATLPTPPPTTRPAPGTVPVP